MTARVRPTTHLVKLLDRQYVAERTAAFWFEKPENFVFEAGQFSELFLVNADDKEVNGQALAFSMASAPEENRLLFAARMRGGAFKRALETMPAGEPIKIEGPFGNFTFPLSASRPVVFIAGGIGITPIRSMIVHAIRARLQRQLFLFYLNRRPEDAAFLDELQSLQKESSDYRFIGVMSQMDKSSHRWQGEIGHISYKLISKHIDHSSAPIYYIAGSPTVVHGLQEMLTAAGVVKEDIRCEDFVGY